MIPGSENATRQNMPLTQKERAEVQQYFTKIVSKMTKHGLPDVALLKKAFYFAYAKHGNTRRETGEPYIMHPLQVGEILADFGHESDMVASAILHDVIEDCGVTKLEIEHQFGINIADIVEAVTKVSALMAPDEAISKLDLDALSDEKFMNESSRVKKAVYIKCADRIHNLRTISIFPEEKQRKKANNTRTVIIPKAKELHIHNLVDILRTLCLEIEDPERSKEIREAYADILTRNYDTFYGPFGLIRESRKIVLEDGRLGEMVAKFEFVRRCTDSLNEELLSKLNNAFSVRETFTKDKIALFDVYFISSDLYTDKPESLFFSFYEKLHKSYFRFTIIGYHHDDYENYWIMKDWFGNMYHLFVQSETEHMEFTHGVLVSDELDEDKKGMGNGSTDETGSAESMMIPVFKKDGSPMLIAEGATVLDFAFSIDPNVGICARYAFLNGSKTRTPIYTRLKPGDMIEVISDHNKNDQINDIPHATVRWFEYLHTREGTKNLSRWLEKHMDSAVPSMLVYDSSGNEYEIDMASTVLDLAFLIDETAGLHVKKAYINKSQTPADLGTTLRYWDKVRFEYDPDDNETPVFSWLGIVKTKRAKKTLIEYFDQKYNNS